MTITWAYADVLSLPLLFRTSNHGKKESVPVFLHAY